MIQERWVSYFAGEDAERNGWKRNQAGAEKIVAHGGLVLKICVESSGAFLPAIFEE